MSKSRKEIAWEKIIGKERKSTSGRTYALSPEGAWICWEDYGTHKTHGWSIDHWDGDTNNNEPDNLRAMQWRNNESKANKKCYIRKIYADTSKKDQFLNKEGNHQMCTTHPLSPDKGA